MIRILTSLFSAALLVAAPKPVTPTAVVQRQIELFNAHDLKGFLALYAEELEVAELPAAPWGTRNKAWLQELWGEQFKTNPDLRTSVEAQLVSGEFVVQTQRLKGRVGQTKDPDVVVIYQVKAAKILRMWVMRE